MKTIVSLLLIMLLVGSNGCMTCAVLDSAKAQTHEDDNGKVIVDEKSHPGYYALLPLSVPADIATAPIQAVIYGVMLHAMFEPNSQLATNAAIAAIFGTPVELSLYVGLFQNQNGRWPANFNELTSFIHQNYLIQQTNGSPPLAYCRGADFTTLTNGGLRIRYVEEVRTNQPVYTNEIDLGPPAPEQRK